MSAPPLTWLYVPADRPDRVEKAIASAAHAVIIDLEDGVAPGAKGEARANLPALLGGSRDKSRRGRERPGERLERPEENVALGVDLDATLRRARLADDTAVLGQRLGVRLGAELMQELRRPLDVGEEEGDGSGRKVVAHAA